MAVEGIFHIYEYVRETRAFLREARAAALLAGASGLRVYRRIVWLAAGAALVGCVVVPCAAPWAAVRYLGIDAGDALFRAVLGVGLSLAALIVYLSGGAALGCLTAPRWFLSGPPGRPWAKALGGSRSVAGHRAFCATLVLVTLGLMTGVAAFLMYRAPTPGF